MNSFLLFCQDNRSALLEIGGSNAEVTSILGAMWRSLSSEEKLKYKDRASLLPKLEKKPKQSEQNPFIYKFKLSPTIHKLTPASYSLRPQQRYDTCNTAVTSRNTRKNILDIRYFQAAYADFRAQNNHNSINMYQ